jgi:nucleotide-binding universal stress UspA family protein
LAGPLVIGYDGSDEFENVLRRAAILLAGRPALVVVVWEPGVAYERFALPDDITPAAIHVDTAMLAENALYADARRLARKGAELAKTSGFDATGLAIADELTVAESLVHIARARDAQGILVGARGLGLTRLLLGSTSEAVLRRADRPVVVVRRDQTGG